MTAVVAVTGVLAGCGASDETKVRATLSALARATAKKDYRALCEDIFASVLVERVEELGLPCERAMRIGLKGVRRPTLKVLSVRIADDQADARVRSGARGQRPSTDTVHLVKQSGDWRVSSLRVPTSPH